MAIILPNHPHLTASKLSTGLVSAVGLLGLALFSPSAFAVSCDFKNGDVFTEICGYLEAGTIQTGGQMRVRVASTTPNFAIHMQRAGNQDPDAVTSVSFGGAGNHNPRTNSYNALNWGSTYHVGVPAHWTSGIYELNFM